MNKTRFQPHTAYTVTLAATLERPRPANIYVYRAYEAFLVVRESSDGMLRKLPYENVARIVSESAIPPERRYHVPDALLDEKFWCSRSSLEHYSSSPHAGK